jgi:hypothetical protein
MTSTTFRCRREAVKLINARGRLEAIIWFFWKTRRLADAVAGQGLR